MKSSKNSPKLFWAIVSFLLILAAALLSPESGKMPMVSKVLFIVGGILFLLTYTKPFWLMTRKEFQIKNDKA